MDDPLEHQEEKATEQPRGEGAQDPAQNHESIPPAETVTEIISSAGLEWTPPPSLPGEDQDSRRRGIRRNLFRLLSFTLAAFILTAWILVRVDPPFGNFFIGPQEVVRAQLDALDQGRILPAYDMFSPRYRRQVSFDIWRELIATHWRMFHAEVLRAGEPEQSGARVTLDMVLRGADQKAYRAQFTLIRADGRWWIDDLHWGEAPDPRNISHT